jgi:predicted phosphatase
MTKEQQQDFVSFLLLHEQLSNYVENCSKCSLHKATDMQSFLNESSATNAIIGGFSWGVSDEGYDHWNRLHVQWVRFVQDVIENNPMEELKTLVLKFIKEQKMNPKLTAVCNDMHDYVSKYEGDKFVKVNNLGIFES